ncbi:unnamed protein product [Calypogeia fissa]
MEQLAYQQPDAHIGACVRLCSGGRGGEAAQVPPSCLSTTKSVQIWQSTHHSLPGHRRRHELQLIMIILLLQFLRTEEPGSSERAFDPTDQQFTRSLTLGQVLSQRIQRFRERLEYKKAILTTLVKDHFS